MNIIEWHVEGGIEYMLTLTFLLVSLIVLFIFFLIKERKKELVKTWVFVGIRQIGFFSFFFGLFIQIMGLISAFDAIEAAGAASQQVIAGGLKISFYPTAYGLFILLVSKLFSFYIVKMRGLEV